MLNKLLEKYGFLQGKTFGKIAACVIMLVLSGVFIIIDNGMMEKNRKLLKTIRKAPLIKERQNMMKKNLDLLNSHLIKIKKNENIEKTTTGYMNALLDLLKTCDLKVESFQSGKLESDGFLILQFNLNSTGDYSKVLDFLERLLKEKKYVFVRNLSINGSKYASSWVEFTLNLDILSEIQ